MARQVRQRTVHLVGSVPLANEEDVFHAASTTLGDCIKRIPDGETGVRSNWIGWQAAVFAHNPSTELYLGLVHHTDGLAGTRRRMATAAKVVPAFGIATECGFGRRPAETVTPLLQLHREAAESAATSDVAQ